MRMFECEHCNGVGVWYGMAPHFHDFGKTGTIIGSSVILPKENWPDNFVQDPECETHGTYTCPKCDGSGLINRNLDG